MLGRKAASSKQNRSVNHETQVCGLSTGRLQKFFMMVLDLDAAGRIVPGRPWIADASL
jgi:hypothetical protein